MPGGRITYAPAVDTQLTHGSLSTTTLALLPAIRDVIAAISAVSLAEETGTASSIVVQWAGAVSRGTDRRYHHK